MCMLFLYAVFNWLVYARAAYEFQGSEISRGWELPEQEAQEDEEGKEGGACCSSIASALLQLVPSGECVHSRQVVCFPKSFARNGSIQISSSQKILAYQFFVCCVFLYEDACHRM